MAESQSASREELDALCSTVRAYLADRSPNSVTRDLIAAGTGYDRTWWHTAADDLGLAGLTIPTRWGGAGMSVVELCVVLEEMGRSLTMSPYLSVAVAIEALMQSGDDDVCDEILPSVADGSTIATAVFSDDGGYWRPENVSLTAQQSTDGWLLNGVVSGAIDAPSADVLLLLANTHQGLGLFLARTDGPGVVRERLNSLDLTREVAQITLDDVPVRQVVIRNDVEAYLSSVLSFALVADVAEMAGVARKCLEMSVDYAKNRQQFGRAIGSFQAIKHKCAQMLLGVESIDGALWKASRLAASRSADLPLFAAVAKAYASDHCFEVAADNIQIHGGIGFTWEHDAHLYFRRAKALQMLGGVASEHRDWIASQTSHAIA